MATATSTSLYSSSPHPCPCGPPPAHRFGKGQATDDVAVAVRMLLENHLVANLPPGASLWPNDFREQRLYCEEVDLVFKRHVVMLKALYSRCVWECGGGLAGVSHNSLASLALCTHCHALCL